MQITDSKKSYLNSLVFDKECYEKLYSPTEKIAWKIIGGEASKYEHIPVSLCKKFYLVPAGFLGSIAMTIYRLFFLTLSLPWKSLSLKAEIHRMFFIFLMGALRTYAHALMPFNEKKAAFIIQENDFQIQGLFNLYGNAKNKDKFLNQLLADFSRLNLSDQMGHFFSIYDVQENDQKEIKEKKIADGINIFAFESSVEALFRQNVKEKFRAFIKRNLEKIEDKIAACEKLSKLLEEWPVQGLIPDKQERKKDLAIMVEIASLMMVEIASLMPEEDDHDINWIKESVDEVILSSLSCDVYIEIFSMVDDLVKTKKPDRFLKAIVDSLSTLYNSFKNNKKGNDDFGSYTKKEYEQRELFYLSMISYAYSSIKEKENFENPLTKEDTNKVQLAEMEFNDLKKLPPEVQKAIEFLQNVDKIYLGLNDQNEENFVKTNIRQLFAVDNNQKKIKKRYKELVLQFHPDKCPDEQYKRYYTAATKRVLNIYGLYSS